MGKEKSFKVDNFALQPNQTFRVYLIGGVKKESTLQKLFLLKPPLPQSLPLPEFNLQHFLKLKTFTFVILSFLLRIDDSF